MIVLAGADDTSAEPRLLHPPWLADSPSPSPTPIASPGFKEDTGLNGTTLHSGGGGERSTEGAPGTERREQDNYPETFTFQRKTLGRKGFCASRFLFLFLK